MRGRRVRRWCRRRRCRTPPRVRRGAAPGARCRFQAGYRARARHRTGAPRHIGRVRAHPARRSRGRRAAIA
ncbi:hypothetical protein G6F32_017183 [Rhizopus arrhizus]|nr:hypothetical protein G6F32_017183 [Rhizopus arrhizus]